MLYIVIVMYLYANELVFTIIVIILFTGGGSSTEDWSAAGLAGGLFAVATVGLSALADSLSTS